MHTLTPSQKQALIDFKAWVITRLKNHHNRIEDSTPFVLTGHAGTGKTHLIQSMIPQIESAVSVMKAIMPDLNTDYGVHLTATTNFACQHLYRITEPYLASPKTVHRQLGLTVKQEKGKTKLVCTTGDVQMPHPPWDLHFMFVDEASMVDRELLRFINNSNYAVIYVGDPYQLPPVNSRGSPVFGGKAAVLKEQVRQDSRMDPVRELADRFREIIRRDKPPSEWPEFPHIPGIIERLDPKSFQERVDELFPDPHELGGTRILAWTNRRVEAYNRRIREDLLGHTWRSNEDWEPDEVLIVTKTKPGFYAWKDRYVRVKGFTGDPMNLRQMHGVTVVELVVGLLEHPEIKCNLWLPVDIPQYEATIKRLAEEKLWNKHRELQNTVCEVRSPYACTCHKAQGLTLENAILDLQDMSKNNKWREKARMVYVALTRAERAVYYYGNLT